MREDRLRPGRPGKDCPPQQPKNPDERIAEAAERIAVATEKLVPTSNPQLDRIEQKLDAALADPAALRKLAEQAEQARQGLGTSTDKLEQAAEDNKPK